MPDILPASPYKLVGTALSIVRRHDDEPYHYSHLQQRKSQDEEAGGGYQTLQPKAQDAATESSHSALKSTCGSFISTEARSPLATHSAATVSGLQTQGRVQAAVEHKQDSRVFELTNILNRLLSLVYRHHSSSSSSSTAPTWPIFDIAFLTTLPLRQCYTWNKNTLQKLKFCNFFCGFVYCINILWWNICIFSW